MIYNLVVFVPNNNSVDNENIVKGKLSPDTCDM